METPAPESEQKQDMLDDVLDTREYDKKVKSAQTTIFIVAGIQLVFGLFVAFTGNDDIMAIQIGVAVVIAAIFFGLGMWCKSKPFTAIIIALSLYVGLWILDAVYDPTNLVKGILVKVFIVIYLVKGISAAKAAQDIKNMAR